MKIAANTFDLEYTWMVIPQVAPNVLSPGNEDALSVEHIVRWYLHFLDERNAKCTFFVVGDFARQRPQIIRDISRAGHEIACHSFFHDDVCTMSPQHFLADITQAKALLEDMLGTAVRGFRAPAFTLTPENANWAIPLIAAAGYSYDASVTVAHRFQGGGFRNVDCNAPFRICLPDNAELIEFPMSNQRLFGRRFSLTGGGYLRVAPMRLLRHAASQDYTMLYVHAIDFSASVSRLPRESLGRYLRRRIRIGNLQAKIDIILNGSPTKTLISLCDSAKSFREEPLGALSNAPQPPVTQPFHRIATSGGETRGNR